MRLVPVRQLNIALCAITEQSDTQSIRNRRFWSSGRRSSLHAMLHNQTIYVHTRILMHICMYWHMYLYLFPFPLGSRCTRTEGANNQQPQCRMWPSRRPECAVIYATYQMALLQRDKEGGCIRIIHAPGMPGIRAINYVQIVRPMANALDAHSNVRQGI